MRLTTRLMQLTSWLLLQRAVNEGELTRDDAEREHRRVVIAMQETTIAGDIFGQLPEKLRDLIERSQSLQVRIQRIDRELKGEAPGCRGRTRSRASSASWRRPSGGSKSDDRAMITTTTKARRDPRAFKCDRAFCGPFRTRGPQRRLRETYFLPKERPPNFELNFETRPPRSIRLLRTAGPGRVRLGVDIEVERVVRPCRRSSG